MALLLLAWDVDQTIIWATEAQANQSYHCPHCQQPVHLESSHRSQFVHDHPSFGPAGGRCRGERAVHAAAEHAAWRQLCTAPETVRWAYQCQHTPDPWIRSLPASIVTARREVHIPGKRADIGLFTAEESLWGMIEICYRHAIDATGRQCLAPWPWIEITADDVVHQRPWLIRQWGPQWPIPCAPCRSLYTVPLKTHSPSK